ncbi:Acyltransferase family protein [Sphingomonas gellani]|uniref:Acyltransferase family protein n=1 Tax=Sphingomonas gellani TaxID=1166340 RepID=A0A1H8IV35_9SPHN|nr:acyltransferase family protein [Sphingomonas gellani]SEN71807.1 Acyltransferase family protein [Sphingomonas gellani]
MTGTSSPAPSQRHYGMDWLRIGAFALLILYHIAMVFVPWDFHVKSTHQARWVVLPMLATNAWRLTLLFLVSGYASRFLLARSPGPGAFVAQRSVRLLLPLLFGIVVIVPPQTWVELVTKHGYASSLPDFWLRDYFSFDHLAGVALPSWNHLWFVAYLWVYTAILTLATMLVRMPAAQRWFDRVFGGWPVLVLPVVWLVCVHGWWYLMGVESHRLFADPVGHLTFLPAFLFGFGLARSRPAMAAIERLWAPAAVVAIAAYLTILSIEMLHSPANPTPRWMFRPYGIAHALEQWCAIVALIGLAERWGRRDHPLRATLTEAVFPFYLIHQTIIVVAMAALLPANLPGWAEFTVLLVATVAGCALFYLCGRAIPWLRPLIGLRPAPPSRPREPQPAII